MPVRLADEPLACVATGAGMSLEELDTHRPRGRRSPHGLRPQVSTLRGTRDRWPSG